MGTVYIEIPCSYANDTLRIKALGIEGRGWPKEEAFLNAIKASPELYAELCVGNIQEVSGTFCLTVPYSTKVYERIFEIEPLTTQKEQKKLKSNFLKPTSEEVLRYGY